MQVKAFAHYASTCAISKIQKLKCARAGACASAYPDLLDYTHSLALSLSGCVVCTCFGIVIKVLLHSNSDTKRMEDQFTNSHPRRIATNRYICSLWS